MTWNTRKNTQDGRQRQQLPPAAYAGNAVAEFACHRSRVLSTSGMDKRRVAAPRWRRTSAPAAAPPEWARCCTGPSGRSCRSRRFPIDRTAGKAQAQRHDERHRDGARGHAAGVEGHRPGIRCGHEKRQQRTPQHSTADQHARDRFQPNSVRRKDRARNSAHPAGHRRESAPCPAPRASGGPAPAGPAPPW